MPSTCPHCHQQFVASHNECKAFPEFRIGEEPPHGGPGKDHEPALSQTIPVAEAILQAFNLILMACGTRDGFESTIDPRALHRAIRTYRPEDKFAHLGKSNSITPLDEKMHAGRIAQRLLNQSLGTRLKLPGHWSGGEKIRERLNALYSTTRSLADDHGVDLSKWKTLG